MTAPTKLILTKSLRFIALFGTIISAILFLLFRNTFRENQIYSYYGLIIVVVSPLFSFLVLRSYVLQILRNADLLVPAGLFLTVSSIMSLFAGNSAENIIFKSLLDLKLINLQLITFQIVVSVLVNFFNTVLFIGWTTKLLLNFAKSGKTDLLQPFEDIKNWFPKASILLVLKFVVVLFSVLAFFPLLIHSSGFLSSWLTAFYYLVPIVGLVILLVNVATAALLPHLLNSKTNFFSAFKEGIKISWANKWRTLLPILLLMICCGWLTFIRVYYRKTDPTAEFGSSFSYQTSLALKISFNFNNVWVATYPSESYWHSQYLKAVEEESFELNEFRVALLIIFLSIVVNLAIIGIYLPPESSAFIKENEQREFLSKENALKLAHFL